MGQVLCGPGAHNEPGALSAWPTQWAGCSVGLVHTMGLVHYRPGAHNGPGAVCSVRLVHTIGLVSAHNGTGALWAWCTQ